MKNNWFSRNSIFYPLMALIALSVVQFLHAQSSLQSFQNRADRNYETLQKRMREENIPSDIQEHIIYVQNQSTFSTDLLVNSLSFMQLFIQFNILLVFWSFILMNRNPDRGE
ncbi:MAG TPA: hypothetical protein VF599_05635 [Pyrinomonadaceae bacterium]|jgi:hypothetical protein